MKKKKFVAEFYRLTAQLANSSSYAQYAFK